jgi:type IX secretion system protein PorZ/two component regulator with propeller domain
MIAKRLLIGCFCSWAPLLALSQIPAIGNWRDHLPYHQAIAVVSLGQTIWCATPYSLFSVSPPDNSLDRLSKTNGLTETGIAAFQADSQNNKLIVAYNSSNIDIISGKSVYNIPDIEQAAITGNKTVNQIFTYNNQAYLSTGLGVIVLDENKYDVSGTYVIGSNGDTVAVQAFTTDGNFFYAATTEGLKSAPVQSPDLADFHNWSLLSGTNGLGSGPCQQVTVLQGQVLVLQNDSLYIRNGGNWNFLYADGWLINNISVSGGTLLVCEQQADSGRVLVLNGTGGIDRVLQQTTVMKHPMQALSFQGQYWVADSVYGLSAWGVAAPELFVPNSPQSLATGEMVIVPPGVTAGPGSAASGGSGSVSSGTLWVASGGADSNWAPLNNRNGLYRFSGNEWANYNVTTYPVFDSVYDFVTVAVNPMDGSLWAGSFGEGLLQGKPDNTFTIYGRGSPVAPVQGNPAAYRVSGLAFDLNGNGWMANFGAVNDLLLRKADGDWLSFAIPFPHTQNAVSQVLIDNNNQVWIVSPGGNGLFCYNHGTSLDNTSDDQWMYYQGGNGNLPDNNVYCIAKDKSGFIWIGTANGIGVVQCPQSVFSAGSCPAVWPVVQFDNFAGYLFSGQPVQAIAVDGANRKWIGTPTGVWLLSPDAQQIIYHFTADSTPLLNNNVKRIAVDPQTGEVFFATAAGICSFRGTATQGGTQNSNVLVFPNPVPPGYSGTIAIRGLVDGAIVKITELDGRLVYQTNALGGQAIWDGRDYRGRAISTGVYLVLVSNNAGQEKMVTKIVVIGK